MSARVGVFDLLAFGEVLWDIFQTAPDRFDRQIGGAPANVSVQLARLGGRAAVVGAVGRDAFGEALAGRLKNERVDLSLLARRAERTGVAFVLRTDDGQPRFLFYRNGTADMSFVKADLPKRLPPARFALVGSSTLVTPGLSSATWEFVARAKKNGTRIVSDLNVRAHLWGGDVDRMRAAVADLVAPAALIKASADDLAALRIGSERKAIEWVQERAPDATVLVTRGAKKASALGPFGAVHVAVAAAKCVDATGAGDGFLAGALRILAASATSASRPHGPKPWPSASAARAAIEVGAAMGRRVVQGLGAVGADTRSLRKTAERALARLEQ